VFVDSTRAYGATVVAAYSPRVRPGVPVSFPVAWDQLDRVTPADFTLRTAVRSIAGQSPWADAMPLPLPAGLARNLPEAIPRNAARSTTRPRFGRLVDLD
jgi:bifunctional non-homologous end joining protein LigD